MPFTAAHTDIAHIWQYPSPGNPGTLLSKTCMRIPGAHKEMSRINRKGKRTEFQYGVAEKRINKPAVLIHLNLIISPIICFQYKVGCLYGFIPDFTARGKL